MPLPPTINESYASFLVHKRGQDAKCRIVLRKEARAYKEMVRELAAIEWWSQKPFEVTQQTRFAVTLCMFLERNSRDVDANLKLVLDGIMAGIKDATNLKGLSDVRVFGARLQKYLIRELPSPESYEPGLLVTVREWTGYEQVPVLGRHP
jgi:hypothetical protein